MTNPRSDADPARPFEKRKRGYQAMGYELDHLDPSPRPAGREQVIEYDENLQITPDPDVV